MKTKTILFSSSINPARCLGLAGHICVRNGRKWFGYRFYSIRVFCVCFSCWLVDCCDSFWHGGRGWGWLGWWSRPCPCWCCLLTVFLTGFYFLPPTATPLHHVHLLPHLFPFCSPWPAPGKDCCNLEWMNEWMCLFLFSKNYYNEKILEQYHNG